jgi:hypothetical protein
MWFKFSSGEREEGDLSEWGYKLYVKVSDNNNELPSISAHFQYHYKPLKGKFPKLGSFKNTCRCKSL